MASWHEVDRALVAPPGLVGTPRPGVGLPRGLPPGLGFGALNPSLTTGSRFGGGSVPGPMNMVHPEPPPTFTAPTYAPGAGSSTPVHALAPLVAALMSTGIGAGGGMGGVAPAGFTQPRTAPTQVSGAYGQPLSQPVSSAPSTPQGTPGAYGQPLSQPISSSLISALAQSGGRTARF